MKDKPIKPGKKINHGIKPPTTTSRPSKPSTPKPKK